MLRAIARCILKMVGWSILPLPAEEPEKSVICVAPHTSNKDFFLGKLYYIAIGRKAGFLMKKEWFFFPLGLLLRAMGGVPIDRGTKGSTVSELKAYFAQEGSRHIAITPEGTRKRTSRWKTGFYHIATGADVPIQLAVIDYKHKQLGIFEVFYPTGDMQADLQHIYNKYSADQASRPDFFGSSPF